MILLRILAGIRASIGRVTDMKTSLGRCVPGSEFCSPDRELELTGRNHEQQVPRLYLRWQHVLGLVGYWVQKTVKKWTVPQGVTQQVLEMMWREDFVLAGPLSLNLKAMAATAWSLHLLPVTPADSLQVKLKRRAGLLLVLQEVAGIA